MNEDRIVDLALLFAIVAILVLKIIGVITISWIWLLAPIWIPLGLGFILLIIFTIMFSIYTLSNKRR